MEVLGSASCGVSVELPFSAAFFFSLFPSPMMNRFFPANFPNKQYQLLFTQGSGESKEGMLACQSFQVRERLLPSLFCSSFTRFDFQPSRTTFPKPASCSLPCFCSQRTRCQLCTVHCLTPALSLLVAPACQGIPKPRASRSGARGWY